LFWRVWLIILKDFLERRKSVSPPSLPPLRCSPPFVSLPSLRLPAAPPRETHAVAVFARSNRPRPSRSSRGRTDRGCRGLREVEQSADVAVFTTSIKARMSPSSRGRAKRGRQNCGWRRRRAVAITSSNHAQTASQSLRVAGRRRRIRCRSRLQSSRAPSHSFQEVSLSPLLP
jgi:hypothetical protein